MVSVAVGYHSPILVVLAALRLGRFLEGLLHGDVADGAFDGDAGDQLLDGAKLDAGVLRPVECAALVIEGSSHLLT